MNTVPNMDTMMGWVGGSMLVFVLVSLVLYFLPTLFAFLRGHHSRGAILILNLFLGWTFLGWVAALIWAFTGVRR